jgi:hypothetical protein
VLAVYNSNPNLTSKPHLSAHRNQTIIIEVQDLDAWMHSSEVSNSLPKGMLADKDHLLAFIDNIPMIGCRFRHDTVSTQDRIDKLEFVLTRDAANQASKDAWKDLMGSIPFHERFGRYAVKVSVGYPGGWVMDTLVDPELSSESGGRPFYLVVIPTDLPTAIGFGLILAALALFLSLAVNTTIIRDATAPLRPDGRAPFSLARTQMAFWFFLVLASYFLLWVMTDDKDTIQESVLALIGISAGTAIGAALLDAGKATGEGRMSRVLLLEPNQSPQQLIDELKAKLRAQQSKLNDLRKALEGLPAAEGVARDANQKEQLLVEQTLQRLQYQLDFYSAKPFRRFTVDVLGDDGSVSFHRFQIVAWTLVLGVIFAKNVITELAMPEFSATLLGLMGISSGTYIGFKFPEAQK